MRALDCSRVKKRSKSKSTWESFPRPAAEMEGTVRPNAINPPKNRMGKNRTTPRKAETSRETGLKLVRESLMTSPTAEHADINKATINK
ncbi:hypothetical protein GHT06_017697 [Daphnia sinensis]|uniref:Uncharacterized protein n=1 Tax=Daphnia sinensis TaxID=1820382 RepID=A0AAD5PQ88_9CRUS|nr:hypothetical protein GHT06_017697 [Daphnia sinensis]